jgi:transcriptional regulator with XRE-family HTH domain
MTRKVEIEAAKDLRIIPRATVSSKGRGRPIADFVEKIERAGFASKDGLSSAALRAGDLVRNMRKEAGLSQTALAAMIGVKQSRISELEAGVGSQGPTWDVMERVAMACGRSLKPVVTDVSSKLQEAAGRYFENDDLTFTAPGTAETSPYALTFTVKSATVQFAEIEGRTCLFLDLKGSAKHGFLGWKRGVGQKPVQVFPQAIAFIKS